MSDGKLLYPVPLEDRLREIEAKAESFAEWDDTDPRATALRWAAAEIRDAIGEARDVWAGTADAAQSSGWSEDTLLRWARRLVAGDGAPAPWSRMEVESTPAGYRYRVSSIPARPSSKAG